MKSIGRCCLSVWNWDVFRTHVLCGWKISKSLQMKTTVNKSLPLKLVWYLTFSKSQKQAQSALFYNAALELQAIHVWNMRTFGQAQDAYQTAYCVTVFNMFDSAGDAGVQSRRCKRRSHHWAGCHMGWRAKCPAHHQTLSQIPPWSRAWCWQTDIQFPDHEGWSGQPLLLWQGQAVPETLDGSYSCCGSC